MKRSHRLFYLLCHLGLSALSLSQRERETRPPEVYLSIGTDYILSNKVVAWQCGKVRPIRCALSEARTYTDIAYNVTRTFISRANSYTLTIQQRAHNSHIMSGGGSSRIAANLAMQSMTGGMSKKVILSEMTLSQHEIVFKDVISEYGFVVINRHLTLGEFEGIGWKLVDTIDPAEIEASRVWLMEKGYKNLALWNAEAAFALDRTKADNHINVFAKSNMPRFLQYDYLKPDSNADREGATLFWLPHRELDFPNAPVFHAYTTTDPDKFYGQWSPSGANRWGIDVNLAGSGVHQYAAYYTHCQKMVNYPNFVLKEDEVRCVLLCFVALLFASFSSDCLIRLYTSCRH